MATHNSMKRKGTRGFEQRGRPCLPPRPNHALFDPRAGSTRPTRRLPLRPRRSLHPCEFKEPTLFKLLRRLDVELAREAGAANRNRPPQSQRAGQRKQNPLQRRFQGEISSLGEILSST